MFYIGIMLTLTIDTPTTDHLDKINPSYPLTGGGAAQGAVDGLLCVQYDNSASKGEFLEVRSTCR